VFAKIVQEIIPNDCVDILEAFAGSSLLVLEGCYRKSGGRRCGGGRNGGHVERSNEGGDVGSDRLI